MILLFILLLSLFHFSNTIRLFMIGGHAYENSPLFVALANSIQNKVPNPGNCDWSWDQTKCPKVAVITSSHQTQAEGNAAYYQDDSVSLSYEKIFKKFGIAPMHVTVHADNYIQTSNPKTSKGKQNMDILMDADIYFFTGGDQSYHIRAWLNDDGTGNALLAMMKDRIDLQQVVVAGSSAGSMIYDRQTFGYGDSYGYLHYQRRVGLAQKKVVDAGANGTNLADDRDGLSGPQYEHNGGKMTGFRLTNIVYDTHFHAQGRIGRIVPLLFDLGRAIGVGLDENTSLFYQNGLGKVYGQHGVTIIDLSEVVLFSTTFFKATDIKVNFLSEGDSYNFTSKTVISSKQQISNPQFKDSLDSHDIFAPDQGRSLLTRLVDQTGMFNVGYSVIPDDFPARSPRFILTFTKKPNTKGYKRGNSYTVANAYLDISYDFLKQPNEMMNLQTV